MDVYFSELHESHTPQTFLQRGVMCPHEDLPVRAEVLLEAALSAGLQQMPAAVFPREDIEAVHTPRYLEFLQNGPSQWATLPNAGPEIVPNVHPTLMPGSYPEHIVGRTGWHMTDTSAPVGPGTFDAAIASAEVALTAAKSVAEKIAAGAGSPSAYALCRPPGHHAGTEQGGGHCYLNNTAIAAHWLVRKCGPVAVLDIDVHHGNGTQAIFYETAEVFTASVHADPDVLYPFFWGRSDEAGAANGLGANLNLPLPGGTDDPGWLAAIERGLEAIAGISPSALIIALGLDAYEDDPLGALKVTTQGFYKAGQTIAKARLPTLLIQEGGYLSPALGKNLKAFLNGFQEGQN